MGQLCWGGPPSSSLPLLHSGSPPCHSRPAQQSHWQPGSGSSLRRQMVCSEEIEHIVGGLHPGGSSCWWIIFSVSVSFSSSCRGLLCPHWEDGSTWALETAGRKAFPPLHCNRQQHVNNKYTAAILVQSDDSYWSLCVILGVLNLIDVNSTLIHIIFYTYIPTELEWQNQLTSTQYKFVC